MAEDAAATEEVAEPVPALVDEEQIAERQQIWTDIFAEHPANKVKLASIEERKANGKEEDQTLTYSELDLSTVNKILTTLKNQHTKLYAGKGIFVDLGSGCGKTCVAAALLHHFEKVVGIETMQCLHDAATAAQAKYGEAALPEGVEKPELQLIKGDFVTDLAAQLEPLASSISVAFACATCFGEEQLKALASLAMLMPDDSIFVTMSQELPDSVIGGDKKLPAERYRDLLKAALSKRGTDPSSVEIDKNPQDAKPGGWRQVDVQEVQLTWGSSKYFVFKKVPLPVTEAPAEEEGAPAES